VSYLDTKKLRNFIRTKEDPTFNVMLPMNFYSTPQPIANSNFMTASIVHPVEIVSIEMSKKEKKKFGLQ
jgi:hypothetical protein